MTQDVAARLKALSGTPFMKMTGSGNDFVVFDGREVNGADLTQPEVIAAICHRHNGIGADGLVLLEPSGTDANEPTAVRLRYFNRDGTLGELCGNATLCSTRFAVLHGLIAGGSAIDGSTVVLDTDSGRVRARLVDDTPEIDLAPVTEVHSALDGVATAPSIHRIGYARVGVPHVVLLSDSIDDIDVVGEGRPIRQHARLSPDGANVNWLAPLGDGRWAYRTYERGVEDETLACGTGAIACAILLTEWGLAAAPIELVTHSGRPVTVNFRPEGGGATLAAESANGPLGASAPLHVSAPATRLADATTDSDSGTTAGRERALATGEGAEAVVRGDEGPVDQAAATRAEPTTTRPRVSGSDRQWHASLRGEGRVVFRGTIAALD